MFVHEDARRRLIEFGKGPFAVCKALTAKEGCIVGEHFHRNKDESFLLLSGKATRVVIGAFRQFNAQAPQEWHVPRGTFHSFELEAGSVLIGTASEPFDPEDEIKGHP